MSPLRCCHCSKSPAKAYVYNGVGYLLCAQCHERVALSVAALLRHSAVVRGMLHPPRA